MNIQTKQKGNTMNPIKEQAKKIARLQDEVRRLHELINYKEGQRIRLVSDLGKVEERNRELVKEVHQLSTNKTER
tara:strand:- start:551 stop:775 length:225 start_codon:yes stop_codon:yes gene_type:complete